MGTVAIQWSGSQLMIGVDSFGHPLVMGSWPERSPEWAGLKPSDLLLLSAAACSAYDVVMILGKQRAPSFRGKVLLGRRHAQVRGEGHS